VSALIAAEKSQAALLARIAYGKELIPTESAQKLYEYCIEKAEEEDNE
jgi:hypothetical protein